MDLKLAVLITLVILGAGLKLCIFLTTKLTESYPKFAEQFFKPKFVEPAAVLALFFTAWFIPIDSENCGESPIRRLRFSVYEWDGVGETEQVHYKDILFSFDQVGVIWWGAQGAHKKIGGFWEYIGVKPINCRP